MPERTRVAPLPIIRRARAFRLYDARGRRYLDLDREGALLGHRAATTLSVMKSALSQGLATGLPSAWQGRLTAALPALLPDYPVVRLYASPERALAAVQDLVGAVSTAGGMFDPALAAEVTPGVSVALWRPFLPTPAGMRAILPVLPWSCCGTPAAVCASAGSESGLPDSDVLPGFLLAAALRACAALARVPAEAPALGAPAVERAIDAAHGRWARVGPYVRAVFPADRYAATHAEFLRAGVYLRPVYPGPSVLPGECSPGEIRLLADLFAGTPGG
jgi:hypothetical protein